MAPCRSLGEGEHISNNHIITRNIGNLRGFSTDSIFLRPPNVADKAVNIQKAPDGTLQIRRGFQAQIAKIGGMGMGTFDDPAIDKVQTVCVNTDGFLYKKLTKQLYLYYDARVMGAITAPGISNAAPAVVHSVAHGLITGTQVIIRGIIGVASGTTNLNNRTFTITVTGPDDFSLDGTDTTLWSAYVSGGTWSIAFADERYLSLSVYVDPQFIYSVSNQSINCKIIAYYSAQINGNQTLTNTITVQFGHNLVATAIVQFFNSSGVLEQRNVTAVTTTTITIDGTPVSVLSGAYLNQYFNFSFGKGYDVNSPTLISIFLATLPTVPSLTAITNGDTNLPAAFFQILEPVIIPSGSEYTMDYWYWLKINSVYDSAATLITPFPGSANTTYQNSPDFEIASTAVFDDVIYIANGWDFPQKYDNQTVYRAGMPVGNRSTETNNDGATPAPASFPSLPFAQNDTYQYITTFEQIDNLSHIIEGEKSQVDKYTKTVALAGATNVILSNLQAKISENWNTHGALATGGQATVYGPDVNGFYYNFVPVANSPHTMKIGDTAYYGDLTAATVNGAQVNVFTIVVDTGHALVPGDQVYFIDTTTTFYRFRNVLAVTDTSITINGAPVTVADDLTILSYKTSPVFGNVAIVNGDQTTVYTSATDSTIITVKNVYTTAYTIQAGDIVEFIDAAGNLQRRTVISLPSVTTIKVSGLSVTLKTLTLIYSLNQRLDAITLQRKNPTGATLSTGAANKISNAISNNLRINIYRTPQGKSFGTDSKAFLVASIPNDFKNGTQTWVDGIPDNELGRFFENPIFMPNPPPISKYIKTFGNQLFYAGGERGNADNSDRVFFSNGNEPEAVPLSDNFFNVPNLDDDITGIGISGSTLVTTKNHSLWAATGNFLSGQIEVIQIAPGTNIGCTAHASIASIGTLMYFLHTNGVYALTENQLYPTDAFGNAIPISLAIEALFRETNFVVQNRFVLKRATAINYTKDNQYLLFIPCEDTQSTIRTANANSVILAYDYQHKNWFQWNGMNAAGGFAVIDDDLYFQERRFSTADGNVANLYKQHRFYRLVDHADHAGAQFCEWASSWEDLGQPEVRKKFCRCILLMDRLSEYLQFNNPVITFSSYLNRLPGLQNTIAVISQVDNIRNASWSFSGWGWNYWSGYQDSFIAVNLKQGTVAKSIQVAFKIQGINMDMRLAGFQIEAIPENRMTVVR